MSPKIFELLRTSKARHCCQRLVQKHRSLLSRSTHHDPQSPLLNVLAARPKKPPTFDPLALTDRHWSRDSHVTRLAKDTYVLLVVSRTWTPGSKRRNGLLMRAGPSR